jgi:hypothetical protein
MDVTILELHLDGAQFNAPFAGGSGDSGKGDASASDAAGNDADDDARDEVAAGKPTGIDPKPIAVIVVLVGLALLARFLRSGDGVEVEVDDDGIEIEEA